MWPAFRWSGLSMYRQQQESNVQHDVPGTPSPEVLREQVKNCPVRRTGRFVPALGVVLVVNILLEVCVVVNGRYRCDNDQYVLKHLAFNLKT